MPILDTRDKPTNLWGRFIADLVLQLLSFIAENERENIRQRQAEGIRIAKEKGIKFGRPSLKIKSKFNKIKDEYLRKNMSLAECLDYLKISRTSFYNLLKKDKS